MEITPEIKNIILIFVSIITGVSAAFGFSKKEFKDLVIRLIVIFIQGLQNKTLLSHHLFKTSKLYLHNTKFISFPNDCERKEKLFQILIETIINTVIANTTLFLNSNLKGLKKMSLADLQYKFKDVIVLIQEEYEKKVLKNFTLYLEDKELAIQLYDRLYNGLSKDRKTKHIGFKEYQNNNIKHITNFTNNLINYSSLENKSIVYIFLSQLDNMLLVIINDLMEVFDKQNGTLCE